MSQCREPSHFPQPVSPGEFDAHLHSAGRVQLVDGVPAVVGGSACSQRKWRTIVVDPPWRYERTLVQKGADGRAIRGAAAHYSTMSLQELAELPVAEWAEPDAHLYLWATNTLMLEALMLVDQWGFKQKTILTWVKSRIGLGSYFRNSTEHVLFAVRGKATRLNEGVTLPTHFTGAGGRHSQKPCAFYDMVESASPGPYLDVFARKQRMGWSVAGNEVYSSIPELAARPPDEQATETSEGSILREDRTGGGGLLDLDSGEEPSRLRLF